METSGLKVIRNYVDRTAGEKAHTALDEEGIIAMLQNEGTQQRQYQVISLLVRDEDFEKAEEMLQQLVPNRKYNKIDNKDVEIAEYLFNVGIDHYEQKSFSEAETNFKEALKIQPSSEDILYNLALVYLEQKKYDLVLEIVSKIKSVDCREIIDELRKAEKKRSASFEDYCPRCLYFEMDTGACNEIHENVRRYPKRFIKKCNGKLFKNDPDRSPGSQSDNQLNDEQEPEEQLNTKELPGDEQLIIIYAGNQMEAGLIKGALEDNGITAFLKDEIIGTIVPMVAAPGGAFAVKVVVPNDALDKAKVVIKDLKDNGLIS